jgi:hypothetical protein|tara:strand:+ start:193 stop:306 length:114 start_codon:yes stop_codon:yes gene_type:complete
LFVILKYFNIKNVEGRKLPKTKKRARLVEARKKETET